MEVPQVSASRVPWSTTRARPAPVPALRDAHAADSRELQPWVVIGAVGGVCWLVVTLTALLWMQPRSGTVMDGMYVITTGARAIQHAGVFLVAAVAYRAALALGWPAAAWARVWVGVVNTLLALAVVAFSQLALALVTGFVDQRPADMRDTVLFWAPLSHAQDFWAAPLRFFLAPYILGLCAIALVLAAQRSHREALHTAELASAYAAARMTMLSAQLQPHFLFNSLNAISELIDESPRQATTMVARLGDFLRHALDSGRWPWIELANELAGLEAYLAVQETRFSDLHVAIDAATETLGVYVPSLLLQPLAENAIMHGRRAAGQGLRVAVTARTRDGRLHISVSNSMPRLSAELAPADYGHGLTNVALRLRAAYDGEARLTIGPDAAGGTSASLDLPLRHAPGTGVRESAT